MFSIKFCQFVVILYPHTFINFGCFMLIFSKMALIAIGSSFLPFQVSIEFNRARQLWFSRQGYEWPQIHPCRPRSTRLSRFRVMRDSVTSCIWSQKQFPSFRIHFNWFRLLHGPHKMPITTAWKTSASDCRLVCQPFVDILNSDEVKTIWLGKTWNLKQQKR